MASQRPASMAVVKQELQRIAAPVPAVSPKQTPVPQQVNPQQPTILAKPDAQLQSPPVPAPQQPIIVPHILVSPHASSNRGISRRFVLLTLAGLQLVALASGIVWLSGHQAFQTQSNRPIGTINEFPLPTTNSKLEAITSGSDGNFWFTEDNANRIGRITSGK